MWQHSAPSNLITRTPQHDHPPGKDSPSDLPEPLSEETLGFQEEYPQEAAEEAEEEEDFQEAEEVTQEDLLQHLKEQEGKGTNLSETCHPSSQETEQSQKHS